MFQVLVPTNSNQFILNDYSVPTWILVRRYSFDELCFSHFKLRFPTWERGGKEDDITLVAGWVVSESATSLENKEMVP